jgi:hypothetical protein
MQEEHVASVSLGLSTPNALLPYTHEQGQRAQVSFTFACLLLIRFIIAFQKQLGDVSYRFPRCMHRAFILVWEKDTGASRGKERGCVSFVAQNLFLVFVFRC